MSHAPYTSCLVFFFSGWRSWEWERLRRSGDEDENGIRCDRAAACGRGLVGLGGGARVGSNVCEGDGARTGSDMGMSTLADAEFERSRPGTRLDKLALGCRSVDGLGRGPSRLFLDEAVVSIELLALLPPRARRPVVDWEAVC